MMTGSRNLHVWCDIQLTKDGAGICFPDIRLNNNSDIDKVYEKKRNTYTINGVQEEGWFSVDFTLSELASVNCKFDSWPSAFLNFLSEWYP